MALFALRTADRRAHSAVGPLLGTPRAPAVRKSRERLFAAQQASSYLTDPQFSIGTSVRITQRQRWSGEQTTPGVLVMMGWNDCVLAQRQHADWHLATIPYHSIQTITPIAAHASIDGLDRIRTPRAEIDIDQARLAHDRLRLFAQFRTRDVWGEIAPTVLEEFSALRGLPSRRARTEYVQTAADRAMERICTANRVSRIGWHYNLHGGHPENFVAAGGIRASRGDIAALTSGRVPPHEIYFFNSELASLFETLHCGNPASIWGVGRMGYVLIAFDQDAPALQHARANGAVLREAGHAMAIDTAKAERSLRGAALGIPYSAFLAPPMLVFDRMTQWLGVRYLTRLEETLATVRYLEQVLA